MNRTGWCIQICEAQVNSRIDVHADLRRLIYVKDHWCVRARWEEVIVFSHLWTDQQSPFDNERTSSRDRQTGRCRRPWHLKRIGQSQVLLPDVEQSLSVVTTFIPRQIRLLPRDYQSLSTSTAFSISTHPLVDETWCNQRVKRPINVQ